MNHRIIISGILDQEPLVALELPLPPTVNKAYFQKGKRKVLTSAARAFKEDVKRTVSQQLALRPDLAQLDSVPLVLILEVYFESIINKGWLEGKAKSLFKKLDASNRIKLLEDALCGALGIDDKQYMTVMVCKHQHAGRPVVKTALYRASCRNHGVNNDHMGTGGDERD